MDQKFFYQPFAGSGDKVAIPETVQPSGAVSYPQGFGPDYELDLGVDPDAKAVPRDVTNELFYQLTFAVGDVQKWGTPEWADSADNGGSAFLYGRGAIVRYRANPGDPFVVYVSRVANNIETPGAGTDWAPFIFESAANLDTTSTDKFVTPAYVTNRLAGISVSVPNASETVRGIVELATTAEGNAGTDDERAMTPLKTASAIAAQVPTATTSLAGRVRLATGAEALAGTATDRAVTPAALATAVPSASEGAAGKVALATAAEATAQAVTNKAVPPSALTGYARTGTSVSFTNVTATSYNTTSARDLKTVLGGIDDALEIVERLAPVMGAYIAELDPQERARPFLIAEDTREVLPGIVAEDVFEFNGKRYAAIDYAAAVPVLVAAIQQEAAARRKTNLVAWVALAASTFAVVSSLFGA